MYQMSWDQVAAVALKVGWTPAEAVIASSITEPESNREPAIIQQGQPYATTGWGLWQITPGDSVPQFGVDYALLDPVNNGKAAKWKYDQAAGWSPWTTDVNRLNVPWIPDAEAAVARVAGLTAAELDRLVADARHGIPAGGHPPGSASDWSPLVRSAARHGTRAALGLAAAAHVIHPMRPRFDPPRVVVPAPAGLLWEPGEQLPA